MKLIIAMPVYEDWESALSVCQQIDDLFRTMSIRPTILIVDDGSAFNSAPKTLPFIPVAIEEISVLPLLRNMGHQRAICIAISYLQEHYTGDALAIMDGDGQDLPEHLPLLLDALKGAKRPTAVFAERGRRMEGVPFRLGYQCYRLLHHLLTGRDIRFGNFSVLPWSQLRSLAVMSELWNHYSAGFLQSRLPYIRVRADRGRRLYGRSRMNYPRLIVHGLSALFANYELVCTRLLVMSVAVTLLLLTCAVVVIGLRLFGNISIPAWAASSSAVLLVVVSQALIASCTLSILIMINRGTLGFIPIRDYRHFVGERTISYAAVPESIDEEVNYLKVGA